MPTIKMGISFISFAVPVCLAVLSLSISKVCLLLFVVIITKPFFPGPSTMSPSKPQSCLLEAELKALENAYTDLQKVNDRLQKKNDALVNEVSTLRGLVLQDCPASSKKDVEEEEGENVSAGVSSPYSASFSPANTASVSASASAFHSHAQKAKEDDEMDHMATGVPATPPNTPEHHHPPQKAIVRDPSLVDLVVTLQVVHTGTTAEPPQTIHHRRFHLNALECSSISQFCHRVASSLTTTTPERNASTGPARATEEEDPKVWTRIVESTFYPPRSATRHFPDLARATVKLEEDGHVAEFTVTPTTLDAATPFPGQQYRAWYERNVVRGRGDKTEYEVKVKMTVQKEA